MPPRGTDLPPRSALPLPLLLPLLLLLCPVLSQAVPGACQGVMCSHQISRQKSQPALFLSDGSTGRCRIAKRRNVRCTVSQTGNR